MSSKLEMIHEQYREITYPERIIPVELESEMRVSGRK
jgi:hypothetical protein